MCLGKVFSVLYSYVYNIIYKFLCVYKDVINVARENNGGIHSQTPLVNKFTLI